jgi:hypothetical protein
MLNVRTLIICSVWRHITEGMGVPEGMRVQYMKKCREKFGLTMPETDKVLQAIATKCNVVFKVGDPKSDVRWGEKARRSYNFNLRRMTDIERRSFVCENFDEIGMVLELIAQDFQIIRIKNRFAESNSAAKDTAAYRDCQVVCYALKTKMMFEIQLHLDCIFQLKDEIAVKTGPDGRTGHENYIRFRVLKESADLAWGRR